MDFFNLPSSYEMTSTYKPVPKPDFYSLKKLVTLLIQVFTVGIGLAIVIVSIRSPIKKYKIEI